MPADEFRWRIAQSKVPQKLAHLNQCTRMHCYPFRIEKAERIKKKRLGLARLGLVLVGLAYEIESRSFKTELRSLEKTEPRRSTARRGSDAARDREKKKKIP